MMKEHWVRKANGQIMDVSGAISPQERQFAQGDFGIVDSRYALELAIDLLSREAECPQFAAGNAATRMERPGEEGLIAA